METVPPILPTCVLAYDTETTGIPLWKEPSEHPDQPHIVQLAARRIDLVTRETIASMDVIIKPDGWTIPDDVIAIHGITNERAMDEGIPEKEAIEQLLALWDAVPLIGHNESFDRRMVRIGIKRHIDPLLPVEGQELMADKWKAAIATCTCWKSRPYTKLDKNKLPKLTEAYQHFMGKPMEGAHSAMGDVDGCLAVYFAIKDLEAQPLAA